MGKEIALLKTAQGEITLNVRVSARARRIGLRVDPKLGGAELILPPGVSTNSGLKFARSKAAWLYDHVAALPRPIPFIENAEVPVFGLPLSIRHMGRKRSTFGPVWRENDALCVSGDPKHMSRRVTDWLKKLAREEITARATGHAETLDVDVQAITLRDTRSRWGSCSSSGGLSFSWRLIMAPENVLDYVVAHEVAHLRQMNHSPRFWKLVDQLVADSETPKAWLRLYGSGLHRFGATSNFSEPEPDESNLEDLPGLLG